MDGESTEIVGTGVPAIADDGTGAEASTEVTLAIAFAAHDGDVSRRELWWTLDTPTTKVVLTNMECPLNLVPCSFGVLNAFG